MSSYMKRCLLNCVKNNKFFIQAICNRTTVCSNAHCTNISWFWNNTSKRFYCQVATQNVNIPMDRRNEEQRKLDEFISNPDNKKIFQVLELEIDVMRHNAEKVPTNVEPKAWLELLHMQSKSQRKKFLHYLFINEKMDETKKAKAAQKKAERLIKLAEEKQAEDTGEIKYGLTNNTMFMRIYPHTISHYYNSKLIWNMMFEPKIVFDCGYEDYMNRRENHNCAKQLTLAFSVNRNHNNPMSLNFCNLKKESLLSHYFQRFMPNLFDQDFPAIVTSQSYLDLFPKDQLVYLTPHCKTDLVEYDPDMVYIIGAMVDKVNPRPLSLAKAKKEGLRMAKLPIEKYLDWGRSSTKSFTLNQMLCIMLDLKYTRSWEQAFQHVPTRKLKQSREQMLQKKLNNTSKLLEKMEKISNNKKSEKMEKISNNENSNFNGTVHNKLHIS
ncbi:mitochondrial ribonuclease P protein 1 homolog [Odontomachus brunneus]|uniref:mitochondrial ribonuclease P protein 1 homolog n=1 Tax=Odontomachus brunneus TaxID=486640 RepID=UPI0013F28BE3|nr:mitochondrial ribonuclease P protein 1 homolog [Odontomachus brunneus]